MAKLNWLIQLRNPPKPSDCGQAVWTDCGGCPDKDAFGNAGYQNKVVAVAAIGKMRDNYPAEAYRLIRIAE